MIKIKKAEEKHIGDIMNIHSRYLSSVQDNNREKTFIDARVKLEMLSIIKEGKSFVIYLGKYIEGYSLFTSHSRGVIGKGILLNEKVRGLGIQRMIYKLVNRSSDLYIVCSKWNTSSMKNVISLNMYPVKFINKTDVLYEKRKTY